MAITKQLVVHAAVAQFPTRRFKADIGRLLVSTVAEPLAVTIASVFDFASLKAKLGLIMAAITWSECGFRCVAVCDCLC